MDSQDLQQSEPYDAEDIPTLEEFVDGHEGEYWTGGEWRKLEGDYDTDESRLHAAADDAASDTGAYRDQPVSRRDVLKATGAGAGALAGASVVAGNAAAQSYGDVLVDRVDGEIQDVWNQEHGHHNVSEYHDDDMRIAGVFGPIGNPNKTLDRDGYRDFVGIAHGLSDSLRIFPHGDADYLGKTHSAPTDAGEDEDVYGRTSGGWTMGVMFNGVPMVFSGHGNHWWNQGEDSPSGQPRAEYNDVRWSKGAEPLVAEIDDRMD